MNSSSTLNHVFIFSIYKLYLFAFFKHFFRLFIYLNLKKKTEIFKDINDLNKKNNKVFMHNSFIYFILMGFNKLMIKN